MSEPIRYPLVMHRGQFPNIQSKHVHSAEQETEARAEGFTTDRPHIPDPAPEKPVLTLEERVQALEDRVAEFEAKRGPGRPRKGE